MRFFLWVTVPLTGPRVTACAMGRTLVPRPAGDRNARSSSPVPPDADPLDGHARNARRRRRRPDPAPARARRRPTSCAGSASRPRPSARPSATAGWCGSSRAWSCSARRPTRGCAGCGSGCSRSTPAAGSATRPPPRSTGGRAVRPSRSSSPCPARRGGCGARRRCTPPTTSVRAMSARSRACAARRRSAPSSTWPGPASPPPACRPPLRPQG